MCAGLRHDTFQIPLARQPEELHAIALDMIGVPHHGRLLGDDTAQEPLAFDQRAGTQILAIKPEKIEDVIDRLPTAAEQVIESRASVSIQHDGLAVKNRLEVEFLVDRGGKLDEAPVPVWVAAPGDEPGFVLADVGEGAEAVHLQLEDEIGVVEGSGTRCGRGWAELQKGPTLISA